MKIQSSLKEEYYIKWMCKKKSICVVLFTIKLPTEDEHSKYTVFPTMKNLCGKVLMLIIVFTQMFCSLIYMFDTKVLPLPPIHAQKCDFWLICENQTREAGKCHPAALMSCCAHRQVPSLHLLRNESSSCLKSAKLPLKWTNASLVYLEAEFSSQS